MWREGGAVDELSVFNSPDQEELSFINIFCVLALKKTISSALISKAKKPEHDLQKYPSDTHFSSTS